MLENLKKPEIEFIGCKVMKLARDLGPDDGRLLLQYVNDQSWIAEHLVKALNERGVMIGARTIRTHRNNTCVCRKLDA